MREFWPICLEIALTRSSRRCWPVEDYVGGIVGEAQVPFIQRRSFMDSVAAVEETLASLRERGNKEMLVKIDFKMTFGTLHWDFLLDNL